MAGTEDLGRLVRAPWAAVRRSRGRSSRPRRRAPRLRRPRRWSAAPVERPPRLEGAGVLQHVRLQEGGRRAEDERAGLQLEHRGALPRRADPPRRRLDVGRVTSGGWSPGDRRLTRVSDHAAPPRSRRLTTLRRGRVSAWRSGGRATASGSRGTSTPSGTRPPRGSACGRRRAISSGPARGLRHRAPSPSRFMKTAARALSPGTRSGRSCGIQRIRRDGRRRRRSRDDARRHV